MGRTKVFKITAFLMAIIMIVGLFSGCTPNDNEIVYTIDGVEIPSGVYIQIQQSAYNAAVSKAVAAEQELSEKEVDATSIQYNILKKEIDGMLAGEWIEKETLEILKRYVAVDKEFTEFSLEIPEEDITEIKEQVETAYTNNKTIYNFLGIGQASIEKLEIYNKQSEVLYNHYYISEGSPEKVSMDEALVHLNENYTKALLYPISITTIDEDKQDQASKDMEEIAEKLSKDDAGFAQIIKDFAKKYGIEGSSGVDDDLEETYGKDKYSMLITREGSEYIPLDTVTKIWSMTSFNKYIYFETNGIGQLISRYEQTVDDVEKYYDSLVQGMRREEFQQKLSEIGNSYEATGDAGLLKKYSAKNLTKKIKKANELFRTQ